MPNILVLFSLMLVASAFKLYTPVISGWIGERRVQRVLEGLDRKKFTCFHNVLLPIGGETTQIDHLVFSGNTCFVIETKAHGGWIFGSKYDGQWTQSFGRHKKYKFQNPIRQNHKHLIAVTNLLGSFSVEGVVVFTRATFKSDRIVNVLYIRELKRFLRKNAGASVQNNEHEIQTLIDSMIVGRSEQKAHVRRLQDKYGGRWRIPVAHTLMIVAAVLFLFRPTIAPALHYIMQPTISMHSVQNSDKSKNHQVYTQRTMLRSHVANPEAQSKTEYPKSPVVQSAIEKHLFSPTVNGLMKGKVVVSGSKGRLYVVKVGEVTEDGWKLLAADSASATFLHSSGQKAVVTIR